MRSRSSELHPPSDPRALHALVDAHSAPLALRCAPLTRVRRAAVLRTLQGLRGAELPLLRLLLAYASTCACAYASALPCA
jgi:hypothetical protein